MSSLAPLDVPSNADRWPSLLLSEGDAERCYYAMRGSTRRWVEGLFTRGGVPRWDRIRKCGDPRACFRISDGACSWQHTWCRDRACYACARSRSRRLATSLRTAIDLRPTASLWFVTLTRPKLPHESCRDAYDAWVRAWERLRHRPFFGSQIVGGVRTMEVTWSPGHDRARWKMPGWHVHAHLVVEVRRSFNVECGVCHGTARDRGKRCTTCCSATTQSDGTLDATVRTMMEEWAAIVGGSTRAQCGVPLNRQNAGQLAKYVTKLWELEPARSRELFDAITGKQIVSGFGEWYSWRRWGDVEATPRGWYASDVTLWEIERMTPATIVKFVAPLPGVELIKGGEIRGPLRGVVMRNRNVVPYGTKYRPRVDVAALTAGQIMRALGTDNRPVWKRDDKPPQHDERCQAMRDRLREVSQTRYGPPPVVVPWYY